MGLIYPHFELPFALQADASSLRLSAALTQEINGEEKVIEYASRVLRGSEFKYSTTEVCLAVIFRSRKFKPYIGYHVVVVTDHQSMKWLRNIFNLTGRISRWIMEMLQHDLEIKYRKENHLTVPDAISRKTYDKEVIVDVLNYSEQEDGWIRKVKEGGESNPAKLRTLRLGAIGCTAMFGRGEYSEQVQKMTSRSCVSLGIWVSRFWMTTIMLYLLINLASIKLTWRLLACITGPACLMMSQNTWGDVIWVSSIRYSREPLTDPWIRREVRASPVLR